MDDQGMDRRTVLFTMMKAGFAASGLMTVAAHVVGCGPKGGGTTYNYYPGNSGNRGNSGNTQPSPSPSPPSPQPSPSPSPPSPTPSPSPPQPTPSPPSTTTTVYAAVQKQYGNESTMSTQNGNQVNQAGSLSGAWIVFYVNGSFIGQSAQSTQTKTGDTITVEDASTGNKESFTVS